LIRHLLVIGAQRCGTTYLRSLLDAHPEITMARPFRPEPKVFMSAELTARGMSWYHETYFAHASDEMVYGEKSTSYIEDPDAARRARAMLGEVEVLVQFRDPVARAISNWRFSTEHGLEHRPLVDALEENLHGPLPWDRSLTSVSPFAYLERGRYIDYLDSWQATFPGSVHLLLLEDFDTQTAALDLYRRLRVRDDFVPPELDVPVNISDGSPPVLDPGLVAAMRTYFEPTDTKLSRLLGRELPWPMAA